MNRWLVVLAVAGCNRFLELDEVQDRPVCTNSLVSDDFEAPSPVCGTWGTVSDADLILSRYDGTLMIAPKEGVEEFSDCHEMASIPFEPEGVFVELALVPMHAYGNFQLETFDTLTSPDPTSDTSINFSATHIEVVDQKSCSPGPCTSFLDGSFAPEVMKWLRYVPSADKTALVVQYSTDGLAWSELATRDISPAVASYVRVTLGGGVALGSIAPTPVRYESLGLCP